jgi:hypothetical protein
MGRESQLDLLPSACQRMYRVGAAIPRGWSNMGGTPEVSMMDCKNLVVGKAVYSGDVYRGPARLQKGGHAGSRRRAVIGLDLILGPIPKSMDKNKLPCCATRIRSLMGKATHLCRVIKLWLVTPCSGKELRTRQERNSMKF